MTTTLPCPDPRARLLAKALGGRVVRGKLFLHGRRAAQFQSLYDAGFHVVRRGSRLMFRRDPKALDLYAALQVARNPICGLTANGVQAEGSSIPNQD